MPCPERDQTIYIQEKEVKTMKTFKYLGSMFDANGGVEKDVNNRVKIAWLKWRETTGVKWRETTGVMWRETTGVMWRETTGVMWRETTGVMCDRNIPTKLKDKVYKTAIKPAMVYGAECWAVRKKEERKLHTTERRMLRWARGKTRLDHVRNADIWKEAHMYPMAEFLREKRLRWFGHVQRRDKDEATRNILQMTVDGKRNRGRLSRDGDRDDRSPKTLACHDPSRHTTKCRGG